jgi:hypothetical protein
MKAIGMSPEPDADQIPPRERGPGAPESRIGQPHAPSLGERLQGRAGQALKQLRAICAGAPRAGIAAWRSLTPALGARMGQALSRVRAIGLSAQETGIAAWRTFKPALAARLHQALERARARSVAAHSAGIAAWRAAAPLLEGGIDQARRHARAIAAAAWQARTDRFVLAGFAAIAIAVAGWLVMLPGDPGPSGIARSPDSEHPRAIAGASAVAELTPIPPPLESARAPELPNLRAPDAESNTDSALLPARLKPTPRAPTLAVRLKPGTPQSAAPNSPPQPATGPQATLPLNATPAKQLQQPTREPDKRADPRATDRLLDQMFSDGLGHSLSRSASDAPVR